MQIIFQQEMNLQSVVLSDRSQMMVSSPCDLPIVFRFKNERDATAFHKQATRIIVKKRKQTKKDNMYDSYLPACLPACLPNCPTAQLLAFPPAFLPSCQKLVGQLSPGTALTREGQTATG